jgi:uncharacterized membrane protein
MKSIIYNLLKQSYDFFAVALTTGFIFSFFFPIKHFLLFTIGVVIADTVTGINAAKKEGKAITSKGLYRTTEKIVVYFTSILIFHGAQLDFCNPNTYCLPCQLGHRWNGVVQRGRKCQADNWSKPWNNNN